MLPQTGPSLWAWARGQGMLGMSEELFLGGESIDGRNTRGFEEIFILYGSEAWSLRMIQWRHIGWVNIRTLYPSLLFWTKHAVLMHQWINESKTLQAEAGSEALAGLGDLKDFVGVVFLGLEKKQLDWSIDHDLRILLLCTYEFIWIWMLFTCSRQCDIMMWDNGLHNFGILVKP